MRFQRLRAQRKQLQSLPSIAENTDPGKRRSPLYRRKPPLPISDIRGAGRRLTRQSQRGSPLNRGVDERTWVRISQMIYPFAELLWPPAALRQTDRACSGFIPSTG